MFPKYRTADNVPEATIYSVRNAQAMLRNGFTTVRDVGGGAGIDLAIRNAIDDGAIVGPRVFAAGQALSITGGHGDSNDVPGWVEEDPSVRAARSPTVRTAFANSFGRTSSCTSTSSRFSRPAACSRTATCGTFRSSISTRCKRSSKNRRSSSARSRRTRTATKASRSRSRAACTRSSTEPA